MPNFELHDFLAELNDEYLNDFVLNISTKRMQDVLLQNRAKLNEAVMNLQINDCILCQSRKYLEYVLEVYLKARLSNNARIVHSPIFEFGISKVKKTKKWI